MLISLNDAFLNPLIKQLSLSGKKSYAAPFWLLIIVICFQLFLWCKLILLIIHVAGGDNAFLYQEQCAFQTVAILVLIVECVVCWRIRKLPYNKIFAWGYVLPLICALVILPLEAFIKNTVYLFLLRPNLLLFWLLIVLSQIFFVQMLKQAYASPKQKQPVDADLGDVIDEFID